MTFIASDAFVRNRTGVLMSLERDSEAYKKKVLGESRADGPLISKSMLHMR